MNQSERKKIEDVLNLLKTGKIEEAISEVGKIKINDRKIQEEFILISSRWHQLKKNKIQGSLPFEDLEKAQTEIIVDILHILKQLGIKQEDIGSLKEFKHSDLANLTIKEVQELTDILNSEYGITPINEFESDNPEYKMSNIILSIDGKWTINYGIELLMSIKNLYDYFKVKAFLQTEGLSKVITKHDLHRLLEDLEFLKPNKSKKLIEVNFNDVIRKYFYKTPLLLDHDLEINKIHYGSPGTFDFVGLGAVIGHLKEFLIFLIDRVLDSKKRKKEIEKLEIENQILSIERNQKYLESLEKIGFTKDEIKEILAKEYQLGNPLIPLINRNQIKSVE